LLAGLLISSDELLKDHDGKSLAKFVRGWLRCPLSAVRLALRLIIGIH